MTQHVSSRWIALAGLLCLTALASLSGCGGGHYESQFEATVEELRNKTGFNEISDIRVVDLEGTEMTIRLPKMHVSNEAGAIDAESTDPRDTSQPLSAERLQPLGLELPGYLRTYETFIKIDGTAEPSAVYCILAAVPTRQMKGEALRQQILDEFEPQKDERAQRNQPVEWTETQIRTPAGTQETWWKLAVKLRDQRFHFYEWEGAEQGQVKSLVLPAYYEIYLHEGEKENVIVAWRSTQEAAEARQLPEIFQAAVGTVEFEKPAEAPNS